MAKIIHCKGRVQGVFFRASTKTRAEELGVTGWVKNESNGDVTIHAEGTNEALSSLTDWCKDGPQFARVDEVWVEDVADQGLTRFDITY